MIQLKPANSGSLDPTFNGSGVLDFPLSEVYGFPDAVLPLDDNKTLVAMRPTAFNVPVIVARLNEDGTLDRSFGTAQCGFVEVPFEDSDIYVFGLTPLANGGWLIVGQYISFSGGGLLIVRQFQDGRLDTSLNGDGKLFIPYDDLGSPQHSGVTLEVAGRHGEKTSAGRSRVSGNSGVSVVEQSDGKIVLVSSVINTSGKPKGIVLRRNSDGSPDLTFAGTGFAIVELPGVEHEWSGAEGVAVQADGQILVTGMYVKQDESMGAFVTCFNSLGQVDRTFNGGLAVTIPSPRWMMLSAITVRESDGRIVAVGNSREKDVQNGVIVVLNKSGSYNLPFNNGRALFSELVPQGQDWARCALHANGSISVTGSTGQGFVSEEMAVVTARYLSDGSLDMTFNAGKGFAVFDGEKGFEHALDMALMADGRIVICGSLWGDGEPLPSFKGGWMLRYLA
jgi:uncharacterized delta-60 repeat protein